jgi:Tol biopolymer transport system component
VRTSRSCLPRFRDLALLMLAAAALAAPGASSPAAAVKVRTLATVNGKVVAFAQDGSRLAWLERPRKRGEGLSLVVRSGGSRRARRIGAYAPQHFQFGGGRAVWSDVSPYGNTRYEYVSSVTVGQRRVRTVARLVLDPFGAGEAVGDVAADGPIAVYGVLEWGLIPGGDPCIDDVDCPFWESGGRLLRLGRRSTAIADAPPPANLAVGGGRILIVPFAESCACDAAPAWSSDGSSIAYSTHRNGDWDVVIGPVGGAVTKVTRSWANEHDPDWSPDGSRLVYESGRTLVVVNRDGTGARPIATGLQPAWSPDGQLIAFVKPGVNGLWLVNADGSGEHRLTQDWDVDPAWSPDGSKLAAARSAPGGWNLTVMDADGSDARTVAAGYAPTWSPDGRRIAYVRYNREELRVVGADGNGDRALTTNAVVGGPRDFSPDWSPDGTKIAFVRLTRSRSELYTISPEGGPVTQLRTTSPLSRPPLEIRTASGALVSRFLPTKDPEQVELSAEVGATLARTTQAARLELFDPRTGRKLGTASLPRNSRSLSISGRTVVVCSGRRIWALETRTRKPRLLTTAAADPLGLSIEGRRVGWAENLKTTARIRALLLP